ncbi:hypothetical protein ACOSP7_021888 [Xanthoceras sorbifolium]
MDIIIISWTWTTHAVLMLLFFLIIQAIFLLKNVDAETKRLPPGPRGFPIFGSLHLLGKYPHRDRHELAQKYGSIMFMRLGLKPTIVVSSPQAAELFLRTHDLVFASRPPLQAFKPVLYGQKDMIMAPYGPYWRTVRKMCTLELLSNHKISSFKSMRKEELGLLIGFIKDAAAVPVDLSAKVGTLSADMTCRMVFGKKYLDKEFDERGFKALIDTRGYGGLTKKLKGISKVYDDFLEKVIAEHVQHSSRDENRNKDFVDLLLSFMGSEESEETDCQIDIEHVKAIILWVHSYSIMNLWKTAWLMASTFRKNCEFLLMCMQLGEIRISGVILTKTVLGCNWASPRFEKKIDTSTLPKLALLLIFEKINTYEINHYKYVSKSNSHHKGEVSTVYTLYLLINIRLELL